MRQSLTLFVVVFLGVLSLAGGGSLSAQQVRFVRGDANMDTVVDVSDGLTVLLYLFGGTPVDCEDALDADDQGDVLITDALYVLNHLFLGGSAPPPPYPGAGFDPTRTDPFPCGDGGTGGSQDVIITEIHYHPLSEDNDDEFLELYNRGSAAVDLQGWRITAVNYTFGAVTIQPGAYLAVARNAARIRSTYGIENVVGDYAPSILDNGGENVTLRNAAGSTIDQVPYDDGGIWPRDADGYGSSLELIDVLGENDTAAAWQASDEGLRSQWTNFQVTRNAAGSSAELHILLLTQGECLIDNLQVTAGSQNRLTNGSFESGMSGWLAQGTHRTSSVTSESAVDGTQSLHLVATGRGDTASNRIERDLSATVSGGQQVTIRGSARWLRGSRFLLTRLHGNAVAQTHMLAVPAQNGTPGAPNSVARSNRGPDITDVAHSPVLPRPTQQAAVSAIVYDPDGVASVTLHYRIDSGAETTRAMNDAATDGDAVAGDGVFTARIPAQTSGRMVGFWIDAADGSGAQSRFPAAAPAKRCNYRSGEPDRPTSGLARYHVFLPPESVQGLGSAPKMSNELFDATFVLNDTQIFYNAGLRYRGSPFIRPGPPTDPVGGRYAYRIELGEHQPLGNDDEINLDNLEPGRDPTLQRERAAYILYRELALPYSDLEYVRLWINGNDHGIYGRPTKVDNAYVQANYPPEQQGGNLHKVDDYFEFDDNFGFSNRDATLSNLGPSSEAYRWNFEKRDTDRNDDFSGIVDLVTLVNTSGAGYEAAVERALNVEQFTAALAARRLVCDWDSLGYRRGKNNYIYRPPGAGWELLPWDIDFVMGAGSDGPTTPIFDGHDPAINRLLSYPKYRNMYLQAFRNLVDGPFTREFLDPILDETYNLLRSENPGVQSPDSVKSWITQRRDYLLSILPGNALVILTNGGADFSTSQTSVTIEGDAPLEVVSYRLNGQALTPTITGISHWSFSRSIPLGTTTFLVEGFNSQAQLVGSDSIAVLRVAPCVPGSVEPNTMAAGSVTLTIHGSGFVPGSTPEVSLASASDEPGFSAFYAESTGSFGDVGAAEALLSNPGGAVRTLSTMHITVSRRTEGGGEIFPTQPFPAPWNTGSVNNLAARYVGFIHVPSAGTRTFGINSDDGFRLRINNQVVAEYPQPRAPATTTGTYNFPSAGSYPVRLDWYENGGGDIVQFFQVNPGGTQRLINDGSEATVTLDDPIIFAATRVEVIDAATIECDFNLAGAPPGPWTVIIVPDQGSTCRLEDGVTIQ